MELPAAKRGNVQVWLLQFFAGMRFTMQGGNVTGKRFDAVDAIRGTGTGLCVFVKCFQFDTCQRTVSWVVYRLFRLC